VHSTLRLVSWASAPAWRGVVDDREGRDVAAIVTVFLVAPAALTPIVVPETETVDAAANADVAGRNNSARVVANAAVRTRRDIRLHELVRMCLLLLS
jgi:hypothetical protein